MMVELIKEKASSQLQAIGGQKKRDISHLKLLLTTLKMKMMPTSMNVHLLIEQQPWGSLENKTYYVYSLEG